MSATNGRVFEIRTYVVYPGKLDAVLARLEQHSVPLFHKHGMESVAYLKVPGDETTGDTLIYVLAHASRDAAAGNWSAFHADPDWRRVKAATEAGGRLIYSVSSVFAEPAAFSPLQ
jgi:hypothetical protein